MGLYKQAADLHRDSLDAHVRLLELGYTAHVVTQGAYQTAFNAAHVIGELEEACGRPTGTEDDCCAILGRLTAQWEAFASALDAAIKGETDEALKAEYQAKLATARVQIAKLKSASAQESDDE